MNRYEKILERIDALKETVRASTVNSYNYGVLVGLIMAEAVVRETEDDAEQGAV